MAPEALLMILGAVLAIVPSIFRLLVKRSEEQVKVTVKTDGKVQAFALTKDEAARVTEFIRHEQQSQGVGARVSVPS